MRTALAFTLGVLLTAATAGAADDAYDIRIQRPFAAGQNYSLKATHTSRSSESVELPNGQTTHSSVFRQVVLEADVHVDQIDSKGIETAATLVVHKLTLQATDGGPAGQSTPNDVLPANTQIIMLLQEGGQPQFATKKAGVLPDDALLALQQGFFRLSITDAVYGTAAKKKIGETWTINTRALGGDKTGPNYIDPALITGSVTLKDQRVVAGLPCLQLDTTMTVKDFPVDGAAAKEATMNTLITMHEPVDATKQIVAWNLRSTTHIVKEESPLGKGVVRRTEDSEIVHESAVTPR